MDVVSVWRFKTIEKFCREPTGREEALRKRELQLMTTDKRKCSKQEQKNRPLDLLREGGSVLTIDFGGGGRIIEGNPTCKREEGGSAC